MLLKYYYKKGVHGIYQKVKEINGSKTVKKPS